MYVKREVIAFVALKDETTALLSSHPTLASTSECINYDTFSEHPRPIPSLSSARLRTSQTRQAGDVSCSVPSSVLTVTSSVSTFCDFLPGRPSIRRSEQFIAMIEILAALMYADPHKRSVALMP